MPGPSDDVPRWQPPEPADDAPRWEPPPPSSDVPRWEPPPAAPAKTVRRRESPPSPTLRREAAPAPSRRAPAPTRRPWPWSWWGRHAWAVVWALVILAPAAVFLLRVLDESGYGGLLVPIEWALAALFLAVLVVAVLSTVQRSAARVVLGVVAVLAVLTVLLWPLTRVTLDHTQCPARAGVDRGVPAAVSALASWERGEADDAVWRGGAAAPGWRDTVRGIRLIDYQLVDSGCWERVAPVDVTRTWHEFRVTIEAGERKPISKMVVVHTTTERGEWKITSVEGPLP
jgi:hypothetical protein